jgi:protein-tyrosine phosphatase
MVEMHLLFVCLGNICRSPAAEAVMAQKLKTAGRSMQIACDSAGIIGYHSGEKSDSRMIKHGLRRGYDLISLSRKVNPEIDFNYFDMIIGMDDQNIKDLNSLARSESARRKIFKMTDFCTNSKYNHVPDPYYGDSSGFELVLDILEDACSGLIAHLEKQLNKTCSPKNSKDVN